MSNPITAFLTHMRDVGCGPATDIDIQDDDAIHRYQVDGDKPGSRNGSYRLRTEADGFGFGWCMSHREGITHSWHMKAKRGISAEDRAAYKARADAARKAAEAARKSAGDLAATRAAEMWNRASKDGSSAYLTRKGIRLHGARVWRDLVIVPVRRGPDIVSLQFIAGDGAKRFLKGGQIDGGYFSIATAKDDLSHIVICEGYATGCTIRQAMGLPVIVAFNAGNLPDVARAIHARYPEARITIAADNDQWTTNPKGEAWNPGIEKAQAAAVAIGGARVLYPQVSHDHPERPTDWNDVGEDAVREAFAAADRPTPERDEAQPDHDYIPEYDFSEVIEDDDPISKINPQGHNDGIYYFYPVESGQITGLTAPGLASMQNLYRLAPRSFWEQHYGINGEVNDKKICAMASAHLMDACHRRGVYLPETTRGVGVWIDNGKVAVNAGDVVWFDGKSHSPATFKGEAVYESGPRVMRMHDAPLRNAEADQLRQIIRQLSWTKPLFADMLAGWLVAAPVGGALPWRPHIWMNGPSGSGKTTVMSEIVAQVLGPIAIMREGGTTEAAVRKALGRSSRPYVLDEAESEGQRAKANMQAILTIARIASSGGLIENANDKFRAQSCFMFTSINPSVEQLADESRITMLSLGRDTAPGSADRYARLLETIRATLTPEYAARLMARTVANMDALLHNAAVFRSAASSALGSARSGDQVGPMLAGAFLLTSTRHISLDEAKSWIAAQEWTWHEGNDADQSDSHRCLGHMLSARVAYDVSGQRRESSIGEIVSRAHDGIGDSRDQALAALRPYGMIVKDGRLIVANASPPLRRIMADTPWSVWKTSLDRYPGADNAGGRPMYFAPGIKARAVSIPLADVLQPTEHSASTGWDDVTPEDF